MPHTSPELAEALLLSFRHSFRSYKQLADGALAQISPAEWLLVAAPGSNSPAIIVRHVIGNLRSRFTNFLTTDGEKPDRQRDLEFEQPASEAAVVELQRQWNPAWQILFEVLDTLQPEDLLRTVYIRGEAHTVLAALQRQVAHYASHAGQLVLLAKQIRGLGWQNLSVPRQQSESYTAAVRAQANSL